MNLLMAVLRIIHIFAGVFWVGASFFNVGFLLPTIAATGPEGQKVMGHLTRQTRFTSVAYGAATLNLLAGLLMYWILSGFRLAFVTSGYGLMLTLGGLSGLVAWILVIFVIRGILGQMAAIGGQIQAQGGPPTPEQGAAMRALGARVVSMGQVNLIFMTIALLGMSIAQYVGF